MNNAYHRGEIEERDLSEIVLEEPFSNLLPRDERLIEELADDISRNGLNKEEPLVLMKKRSDGKLVLVDGLIRYIAAQRAGRTKGPTIIIDFRIEENAIAYALRRQCKRRQNSVPVIVYRLLMSELVSRGGGQALGGKLTQEELAESSGISVRTIGRIKAKYYDPLTDEERQEIRSGHLNVFDWFRKIEEEDKDGNPISSSSSQSQRRKPDPLGALFRHLALDELEKAALIQESISKGVQVSHIITGILRKYLISQIPDTATRTNAEETHFKKSNLETPPSLPNLPISSDALAKSAAHSNKEITASTGRPGEGEHPNHRWKIDHLKLLKSLILEYEGKSRKEIAEEFFARLQNMGKCPYTVKAIEEQFSRIISGDKSIPE